MEPQQQNPFMAMIKGMQQQRSPQGQSPSQPQGNPQSAMPEEDQFQKGVNPDNTKFLVSAIQQLENYVAQSTERDEIATARGIISLLSRLIANSQKRMSQDL